MTMAAPGEGPVVVVGAGTAGCVVARRLAEGGHRVVVLEAGSVTPSSELADLTSPDHLRAHRRADRWWAGLVARRSIDQPPSMYAAGRGLGGSSSVNGLMAEIDPGDPALRLPDGSRSEVDAALGRIRVGIDTARTDEMGPLSRALLVDDHARAVGLARRQGRRSDAGTAYLDPEYRAEAVADGRLVVRGDAVVERIVPLGASGPGSGAEVILTSGERIAAAAVVLCAGALHTPTLLLRSGLGDRVGERLQDHPSATLHLTFRADSEHDAGSIPLVTGAIAERDGLQLLPLERLVPAGPDAAAEGALCVALMEPSAANGRVLLDADDPAGSPIVDLPTPSDEDLERLVGGVRWAVELLGSGPMTALVDRVAIDDRGTPLESLADGAAIRDWLRHGATSAYFHASASCGVGRSVDGDGAVVGAPGVYVADASAFERIPRTGTHLPTMVLAEQLTRRWTA